MVFITRFFQNLNWQTWLVGMLLLCAASAHAGSIKPVKTEVEFIANKIELAGRFHISLSSELETALKNGLSLPFTYEFKLTKPRFYSWYRNVADGFNANATLTYRLSYQPLTRQYRLNTGGLSRNFNSADDALVALSIIKGWSVLEGSDIDPDDFAGKIKLKLDQSLLPKSYQLTALGDEQWQLDSGWHELHRAPLTSSEAAQ